MPVSVRPGGLSSRSHRLAPVLAGCLLLGAPNAAPAADAALELGAMTFVGSEAGDLALLVSAERARYRPGDERVRLEAVELRVVERPDTPGFELRCERATLDPETGDFEARGSVEGRTPDGRELRTEALAYRHASGRVHGDLPVEIREPVGRYRGDGFEYDVREARFRLVGATNVRGGGRVPASEGRSGGASGGTNP